MRAHFYVPDGQENIVHSLVKKHNLRYLHNPLNYFGKWNFEIEGSVEDYNNFEQEKEELLKENVVEEPKPSFWKKIKRWLKMGECDE